MLKHRFWPFFKQNKCFIAEKRLVFAEFCIFLPLHHLAYYCRQICKASLKKKPQNDRKNGLKWSQWPRNGPIIAQNWPRKGSKWGQNDTKTTPNDAKMNAKWPQNDAGQTQKWSKITQNDPIFAHLWPIFGPILGHFDPFLTTIRSKTVKGGQNWPKNSSKVM